MRNFLSGARASTFLIMWVVTALIAPALTACSQGLEEVHMEDRPLDKPLPINTRPRILAIGQGFSVGIKKDGTVWSWGSNHNGILARPIKMPANSYDPNPERIPDMQEAVSVVASSSHVLVLMKDGTVWSWGENDHGQLGYSTDKNYSATPRQVPGLTDVVDIAVQWGVSQALKKDGTVWGFGWASGGRLGKAAVKDHNPLMQINGLKDVVRIEVGRNGSMAIDKHGQLWTYGDDKRSLGRLLKEAVDEAASPGVVSLPRRVVDVSANSHAIFALLEDGTVWSWGYNYDGQLGTGEKNEKGHPLPVKIASLSSVVLLASGMGGAVVAQDGAIATWGVSAGGAPNMITVSNLSTPHAIKANLPHPIQYLVGGESYAVIDGKGDAWYWQGNGRGQRGNGTRVDEPSVEYWTTPEKSHWTRY